MEEHDWDGHGGCVPSCRTCRVKDLEKRVQQLEGVVALLASDGYAISFQTMGQYRTALLKAAQRGT